MDMAAEHGPAAPQDIMPRPLTIRARPTVP